MEIEDDGQIEVDRIVTIKKPLNIKQFDLIQFQKQVEKQSKVYGNFNNFSVLIKWKHLQYD